MLLTSSFLFAHDFEVDSIYYNILSETDRPVEVTYCSSYNKEYENSVKIPLKVKFNDVSYTVTSIGRGAFSSCEGLTSVNIPNSVTTIGEAAFDWCSRLTSVTMCNSVTTIEKEAFSYCSGLTSVTIPNSVTSIGVDAFEACNGLTSIFVEQGNMAYDSRENCNAIIESSTNTLIQGCKKTIIPNSVTAIGKYAF